MSDQGGEDDVAGTDQASADVTEQAKEAKGKAKEKLGWATGDREVEAEGRVEQEEAAADAGALDKDEVDSPQEAEQEVRRAHEEID